MNLVKLSVGIAQERRWAELSIEPPKPKKPVEQPVIVQLTISPEFQRWLNTLQSLMDYSKL